MAEPSGRQAEPRGHPVEANSIIASLTPRQRQLLRGWQAEVTAAENWTGHLPVAVLERCWMRLRRVPVAQLASTLPPDASAEAPELVRYRDWLARGLTSWQAECLCWQEFGSEACQQALRRHWQQREQDPGAWTLNRYLELVSCYRAQLDGQAERRLPLLVLGRAGTRDPHRLQWLRGTWLSMRHTCA
ncbi:MAG: hypothetical protein KFB97_09180 [Cyanobium sp. M30B3]|nr:MAG: hypothetical protein KFB97_09180 [Cyanobium sp. M30B3]